MKLTSLSGLLFSAALCTGAFADTVVSEQTTTTAAPAPIVTERVETAPAPIVTERTTTAPAIQSQTTTTTTTEEQRKLSHHEKERMEKDFKRELKDK